MGRPSKFKPEFCKQANKLTLLGATDKDLASFFEVTVSTINLWKTEHPEFSESLKTGKVEADNRVVRSLYERANGYSHPAEKIFLDKFGDIVRAEYTEHYPPDPTSCIFWLKNRDKENWRDKVETELSGEVKVVPVVNVGLSGLSNKPEPAS